MPSSITLQYSLYQKIILIICLSLCALLFVVITPSSLGAKDFAIAMAILAVISTASLMLFLEVLFVKIQLNNNTITCRSPWRESRSINVSDVVDVYFSEGLKWHRIKTKNDDIINVPDIISNQESVCAFLKNLPV
jgi:hypothetical protein